MSKPSEHKHDGKCGDLHKFEGERWADDALASGDHVHVSPKYVSEGAANSGAADVETVPCGARFMDKRCSKPVGHKSIHTYVDMASAVPMPCGTITSRIGAATKLCALPRGHLGAHIDPEGLDSAGASNPTVGSCYAQRRDGGEVCGLPRGHGGFHRWDPDYREEEDEIGDLLDSIIGPEDGVDWQEAETYAPPPPRYKQQLDSLAETTLKKAMEQYVAQDIRANQMLDRLFPKIVEGDYDETQDAA